MKDDTINRREAVRRFFLASAALAVPGWVALGCKSESLSCASTAGLSADELKNRTETLAYTDASPDPSKLCEKCQLFTSGGEGQCGTCKLVKGPINPKGTCKTFVPKPA